MAEKTQKELIEEMYSSKLDQNKQQITQGYEESTSKLDQAAKDTRKQTQDKLIRTAVEGEKAKRNFAEVQNAYGLSSGAMAQARVAQDNQIQADMTTIRAAEQDTLGAIEIQRAAEARKFEQEIAKAQAENDLAKAEALFRLAQQVDAKLNTQKQAAAQAMAKYGDYTLFGQLNGMTPEQIAFLNSQYAAAHASKHSGGGGGGYSGDITVPGTTDSFGGSGDHGYTTPTVDEGSVRDLGYGNISADELALKVANGEVIQYVQNGRIYFKRRPSNYDPHARTPERKPPHRPSDRYHEFN